MSVQKDKREDRLPVQVDRYRKGSDVRRLKERKVEKKESPPTCREKQRGEIPRASVDESYRSWKEHASKGDSYKLIQRMDKFYSDLWKETGSAKDNTQDSPP